MAFTTIDRYQIKKGLGQGTSGSVFLASDPRMGRDVAIKILQKEFAKNPKHREREPQPREEPSRHRGARAFRDWNGNWGNPKPCASATTFLPDGTTPS